MVFYTIIYLYSKVGEGARDMKIPNFNVPVFYNIII